MAGVATESPSGAGRDCSSLLANMDVSLCLCRDAIDVLLVLLRCCQLVLEFAIAHSLEDQLIAILNLLLGDRSAKLETPRLAGVLMVQGC